MKTNSLIIAFLRHAEYHQQPGTPSAFQPYALTEHGLQQTQTHAQQLHQFAQARSASIHPVIESSSLLRAWQTAHQLGESLVAHQHFPEYKISQQADLNERSVGSVANLTTTEIEQLLQQDPRFETPPPHWKSDSHYQLPFPGAESLMQAGERVANHLRNLCDHLSPKLSTDTIQLVVGHGAAFRHAAYLLGILTHEQIKQFSMHHAQPIYFEIQSTHNGDRVWKHLAGEWKIRTAYTARDTSTHPHLID